MIGNASGFSVIVANIAALHSRFFSEASCLDPGTRWLQFTTTGRGFQAMKFTGNNLKCTSEPKLLEIIVFISTDSVAFVQMQVWMPKSAEKRQIWSRGVSSVQLQLANT